MPGGVLRTIFPSMGLPSDLYQSVADAFGIEIAEGLDAHWPLVQAGCLIMGIIVVIHTMMRVYKSYRFNRQDFRDGALLKFVAGILLVNINEVVRLAVYYAK